MCCKGDDINYCIHTRATEHHQSIHEIGFRYLLESRAILRLVPAIAATCHYSDMLPLLFPCCDVTPVRSADLAKKTLRELYILKRIRHPNLVTLHDVRSNPMLWFTMHIVSE